MFGQRRCVRIWIVLASMKHSFIRSLVTINQSLPTRQTGIRHPMNPTAKNICNFTENKTKKLNKNYRHFCMSFIFPCSFCKFTDIFNSASGAGQQSFLAGRWSFLALCTSIGFTSLYSRRIYSQIRCAKVYRLGW